MNRLMAKLRKNIDYQVATKWLTENGYEFEVVPPRGRGHPILQIGKVRYPLATTPGKVNPAHVIAQLKTRLGVTS